MEGLASSMANDPSQGPSQEDLLQQVMQLLMEGVDPEELIQQGIPPELVMQAIEMLEQQMAAEQPQGQMQPQATAPQGLAQSMVG